MWNMPSSIYTYHHYQISAAQTEITHPHHELWVRFLQSSTWRMLAILQGIHQTLTVSLHQSSTQNIVLANNMLISKHKAASNYFFVLPSQVQKIVQDRGRSCWVLNHLLPKLERCIHFVSCHLSASSLT